MSENPQQYLLTRLIAGNKCENIVEAKYLTTTLDMLLQHYQMVTVERIKKKNMSNIKHTPGPWTIEDNGWNGQFIYGDDDRVNGKRRFIAEVDLNYDEAEANARLIAAAPDLLEALFKLAKFYDSLGEPRGSCRVIADAAIAKATGVKP